MLSGIRRLARPFSIVLLALLVAPVAVDCCDLPVVHGDGDACCLKADASDAALNAECCDIEQAPAHQPPQTSGPIRTHETAVHSHFVRLAESPLIVDTLSTSLAQAVSRPGDPLYLRLATLRR